MAFSLKLCFVGVWLVLLQEGNTLKCYQCSSPLNGDCDEPLNSTKVVIQTCSSPHDSCLLLNITDGGSTEIRRECAEYEYCEKSVKNKREVLTYSRTCRTCTWGLCNSTPSLAPSFSLGIIGLLLIKYYL